MALASVTREQFEIRSEVEVVHIPTGADFRAYPYSDVDDMLQSVKVSWGRAGAPAESTATTPSKSDVWHRSCCLSERIEWPKIGDWAMLLEISAQQPRYIRK